MFFLFCRRWGSCSSRLYVGVVVVVVVVVAVIVVAVAVVAIVMLW